MRIGVDISPLQGPHRMRGIGATVLNTINSLPASVKSQNTFIFYLDEESKNTKSIDETIELLHLDSFNYETRTIAGNSNAAEMPPRRFKVISKLSRSFRSIGKLIAYNFGEGRISTADDLQAFLQFDQEKGLPRGKGFTKSLVIYDIIPYVLKNDYLYTYSVARRNEHSRKGSLLKAYHRWIYAYKLRVNTRRADNIIAISSKTKQDFVNILGISPKKISVSSLGIVPANTSDKKSTGDLVCHHYIETSWAYVKRPYVLKKDVPFLLFVGGVDKRRKVADVVAAFNHLRAEGMEMKLVFAGDILEGPGNIPIPETRKALEASSYAEDIVYMGFVDEELRSELYARALAFVYPSVYEGFGLPVLEAMSHGCSVICYRNQAVQEVAGYLPLYANDAKDIASCVHKLLSNNKVNKKALAEYANQRSWEKTSQSIFKTVTS